mmetsp:Transcript_11306/g.23859  ORF Transcript_11306/g.23859 Transcript_11306/m.23859 type:complete len:401 (-) Transcript_11306:8-1210(-)
MQSVHGIPSDCFRPGVNFTWELCCLGWHGVGDASCWDSNGYNYERCCLGASFRDACGCEPGLSWDANLRRCANSKVIEPTAPTLLTRCRKLHAIVAAAVRKPVAFSSEPAWPAFPRSLASNIRGKEQFSSYDIQWSPEHPWAFTYRAACARSAESPTAFSRFRRSDMVLNQAWEHTSKSSGDLYLARLYRQSFPIYRHLPRWRVADLLGNAVMEDFQRHIGFMSPSTMRYVGILGDILSHLVTSPAWNVSAGLMGWRIAEIGGGYGGQALAMHLLSAQLESYTIFDLPEAGMLQYRFLSHFPEFLRKTRFANSTGSHEGHRYDLCISCFALSELSEAQQRPYAEDVLRHCRFGYVLDNSVDFRKTTAYSGDGLVSWLSELGRPVRREVSMEGQGIHAIMW